MVEHVNKGSRRNPILSISEDEFFEWLRQKADDAGFADRELSAVQYEHEGEPWSDIPRNLTLMVSNIPNSRPKDAE